MQEEDRQGRSRRTRGAAARRPRRRVPLLEQPARQAPTASIYDIPDNIGTAVNVQTDGVRQHGRHARPRASASPATRRPARRSSTASSCINAQGEDVVAGVRTPTPIAELEKVMPAAYKQLRDITTRLERHYKDVQDFEFTIENETALHAPDPQRQADGLRRRRRSRSTWCDEELLTQKEALLLVEPQSLDQLLHPIFDPKEWKAIPVATKGLPASPGAAIGPGRLHRRRRGGVGRSRARRSSSSARRRCRTTSTACSCRQGILTATGGMTSHAAVVGRQMGKPSVVGASALDVERGGQDDHGRRQGAAARATTSRSTA